MIPPYFGSISALHSYLFMIDEYLHKNHEAGFPESLKDINEIILSDKDKLHSTFKEFNSPFKYNGD